MQNKINPRSFLLIKFLLTIGLFLQYTISLVVLINLLKSTSEQNWIEPSIYLPLQLFLLFSSLISLSIFIIIRFYLHKKLNYKYTKKEFLELTLTYLSLVIISIMTIVVIFTNNFLNIDKETFVISLMVVQFVFGITSSILESFSRINEQAIVNKEWKLSQDLKPVDKAISNLENEPKIKTTKKDNIKNPFLEGELNDD